MLYLYIYLYIYIYVYTEEYESICVLDTIHFNIYYEEENLKKLEPQTILTFVD